MNEFMIIPDQIGPYDNLSVKQVKEQMKQSESWGNIKRKIYHKAYTFYRMNVKPYIKNQR